MKGKNCRFYFRSHEMKATGLKSVAGLWRQKPSMHCVDNLGLSRQVFFRYFSFITFATKYLDL